MPGPTGTSSTVELVRRNAEIELIALLELRQRAVPGLDRLLAERAGGRVRVELLNGAREELQALVGTADSRVARGTGARAAWCRMAASFKFVVVRVKS